MFHFAKNDEIYSKCLSLPKSKFKIHLQCKFKTLIIFMSLRKILYIFQAISQKRLIAWVKFNLKL